MEEIDVSIEVYRLLEGGRSVSLQCGVGIDEARTVGRQQTAPMIVVRVRGRDCAIYQDKTGTEDGRERRGEEIQDEESRGEEVKRTAVVVVAGTAASKCLLV